MRVHYRCGKLDGETFQDDESSGSVCLIALSGSGPAARFHHPACTTCLVPLYPACTSCAVSPLRSTVSPPCLHVESRIVLVDILSTVQRGQCSCLVSLPCFRLLLGFTTLRHGFATLPARGVAHRDRRHFVNDAEWPMLVVDGRRCLVLLEGACFPFERRSMACALGLLAWCGTARSCRKV